MKWNFEGPYYSAESVRFAFTRSGFNQHIYFREISAERNFNANTVTVTIQLTNNDRENKYNEIKSVYKNATPHDKGSFQITVKPNELNALMAKINSAEMSLSRVEQDDIKSLVNNLSDESMADHMKRAQQGSKFLKKYNM